MPIQKLILICIVFASALLGSVLAADKPATQADVEKLQEQVRTLDKELAVQREAFIRKLDDVDKRQTEITAKQAKDTAEDSKSLAVIANKTAMLGNLITMVSILITVLVFGAGYVTYLNATSRAKEEARTASAEWFKQNAEKLSLQIEALKGEATNASVKIKTHSDQVESDARIAKNIIQAGRLLVNTGQAKGHQPNDDAARQEATKIVQQASKALEDKPESTFTASNFYTRGVSAYEANNYQSALEAFGKAIALSVIDTPADQVALYLFVYGVTLSLMGKYEEAITSYDNLNHRFGQDTSPGVSEQVAKGLVNKGFALDKLDKSVEAIAIFDDVVQRFSKDTTPALVEQHAEALNGRSFSKIMLSKQSWSETATRIDLLQDAITAAQLALEHCASDSKAMILGNLGYSLFLAGQPTAAKAPTLVCLRLGGQTTKDAQHADAERHRIEPEDTQYELLLDELWKSLPPLAVAS